MPTAWQIFLVRCFDRPAESRLRGFAGSTKSPLRRLMPTMPVRRSSLGHAQNRQEALIMGHSLSSLPLNWCFGERHVPGLAKGGASHHLSRSSRVAAGANQVPEADQLRKAVTRIPPEQDQDGNGEKM